MNRNLENQDISSAYNNLLNDIKSDINPREYFRYCIAIAYLSFIAKEIGVGNLPKFIDENVNDETTKRHLHKIYTEQKNTIRMTEKKVDAKILKNIVLFSEETFVNFGENVTPHFLNQLALGIMKVSSDDILLDLGSGVGGFIVQAAGSTECKALYGVEIQTNNVITSNIKALLSGGNVKFIQGNMLSQEFSYLKATKVFSNFPIGMKLKNIEHEISNHPKLSIMFKNAKRTITSDWIFAMAAYHALSSDGKAVCIMANSGTWNQSDQGIRKLMIEKGMIEGVIALPSNLLPNTGIAVSMVVLSQNNKKIRMVDASNIVTVMRRQNTLTDQNVEEILTAYNKNSAISKSVKLNEIKKNEYAINPVRYIEYEDDVKDGIPLGDVILSINRGAMIKSDELDMLSTSENTGYHYLMLQNIKDGVIDKDLPKLTHIDEKYKKYCITNNSLIVSKISPFKIAMANFNEDETVLANGNLYYIKVDENKVNPVFVEAFLQNEIGLAQLTRLSKGTVMSNISITDLKRVMIPKLSREEQNRIADEYSNLKDQLIVLEKQIDLVKDKKARLLEEVI